MLNKIDVVETPTTDLFITTVIERAICTKHKGGGGGPCYVIESTITGDLYLGVCNDRITRAGFVGKISPQSLSVRSRRGRQ